MITLLVTSCNRIKQTILALTVNSSLIRDSFNLVIADCSTPGLSLEDGLKLHQQTDTYNHITQLNYCSDIGLFEKHIGFIPQVAKYSILHVQPRLKKECGDAALISLGLAQACLMDGEFCVKVTGTEIIKPGAVSWLFEKLKDHDIVTWSFIGDCSVRVFGCRPKILAKLILAKLDAGYDWVDNSKAPIEKRFTDITKNSNVYQAIVEEWDSCLIGTGPWKPEIRGKLLQLIKDENIPTNLPIIQEFLNGGIW